MCEERDSKLVDLSRYRRRVLVCASVHAVLALPWVRLSVRRPESWCDFCVRVCVCVRVCLSATAWLRLCASVQVCLAFATEPMNERTLKRVSVCAFVAPQFALLLG